MNRAGQETFIMNVFRAIDRRVVSFDFLCCLPGTGDYDEEIRQLGGEVYHIELSKRNSKLKQIDNFILLYKYLKSQADKYSAFHIHTQHAMDGFEEALAAKLAGIPVVIVHSHSTSTQYHVKAHKFFRSFLNHIPVTRLACSELAGNWLYGKTGKFEVIRNGVDAVKYTFKKDVRAQIRQDNGWSEKTIIGHVGSFTYPKNHEFIIDIFNEFLKINSNSQLVFAGKGELLDSIKDKCKHLNIEDKVSFLGTRDDIEDLDQAFDIMLFPSRYEGLPVVLVEAQCTGLPCLISDTITQEVDITNLINRMSLENSANNWSNKLSEMLARYRDYKREEASKIVSNKYSMDDTVKRLTDIYSQGKEVL